MSIESPATGIGPALAGQAHHPAAGREGAAIRPDAFPLSFGQEGLWFVDQLAPGNAVYNIASAVHLRGRLDEEALARSFSAIRRRHAICRTTFVPIDGRPVQRIGDDDQTVLSIRSVEAVAEDERPAEALRIASQEADRPFDLATGPLLRATLIRLRDDWRVLVVTLHHIIADGWSLGILFRELQTFYAAFAEGRPAALPPLPIQYADFAVWQRQRLQPDALDRHLAYWRTRLRGVPAGFELPTDRPRPPVQTFRGAELFKRVSPSATTALKLLSHREGTTLFTTALAAFQGFLARYTGQSDVSVVCSVANRTRLETEPLIGFFVNLVVIRVDLRGNPSFRELLQRTGQALLEAYEHQEVPFEMVVDALQDRRDPGRPPLAQVGFSFANEPLGGIALPGLTVTQFPPGRRVSKVDLTLFVRDAPDGIVIALEYNTDLFEEQTIRRMLEQFADWLALLVADPDRRLLMVPLLAAEMAASIHLPAERMLRIAPMGSTQRDLYLSHLIAPESRRFTVVIVAELGTGIDPDAWRRAVVGVVNRDDATRTRFFLYKGEPYQFVDREAKGSCRFVDLTAPSSSGVPVQELIDAELDRKYDLHDFETPILQNILVRKPDGAYIGMLVFHHALLDGTSSYHVFGRVIDAYRSHTGGLARPHSSFYSYVADHLAACDTPSTEAFWTARLGGVAPIDCRPVDAGPPARRVDRVALGKEAFDAVKRFCRAHGCSVPSYMLALYGWALSRRFDLAGDIAIYNIVNGRPRQHRATLGCFFQVLPVVLTRDLLDNRTAVSDYIRHVDAYRDGVGPHQPISRLLQNRIARDGRPKFFYNAYYFPELRKPAEDGRVRITAHEVWPEDEVHLIIEEIDHGLELRVHSHGKYFADDRFAERIALASRQLTAGAASLGELRVLLDEEVRALARFNERTIPRAPAPAVHQLIEAQAERTPDRVAVIDTPSMTYGELNRRANRWARALQDRHVGPETCVALLAARGGDFLTAILAVFKAGAAYLPLDPAQPEKRLQQILTQSRSPLIVVGDDLQTAWAAAAQALEAAARPAAVTVRQLDEAATASENLPSRTRPASLSYVIFTSGSTGLPKGAMLEHGGMLNHLATKVEDLALDARDVVAQSASQAVDVSVWQFLAPLLVGGATKIVPDAALHDQPRLFEALRDVTIFETVPSMWRVMLEELSRLGAARPPLSSLRLVIVNGEVLEPELCRRWFSLYPHVPLVNAYGPTECSDDVTHHHMRMPGDCDVARLPVGRPLANARIYALDRGLDPVPIGAPGHLHVGGIGVGRGYLHDPVRTAAAFIPNPFAERPGERLYRTGDRGRLLPDGTVDFLGRLDHQVKVRGFRVELGEIESLLGQHPDVGEAAVTTRTDVTGENELVAYLVPRPARMPTSQQLRQFLRERVPVYMVPFAFVIMERLPLTTSGKIDRKALPRPDAATVHGRAETAAPQTPVEEQVAAVWRQVLGLERLGIHDNFFELGGHSLSATQVVSRIRSVCHVDVPVQTLFEAPTIFELALRITQLQAAQHADITALLEEIATPPGEPGL